MSKKILERRKGSIERELKGLILCFTHWVSTSEESLSRLNPHEYR